MENDNTAIIHLIEVRCLIECTWKLQCWWFGFQLSLIYFAWLLLSIQTLCFLECFLHNQVQCGLLILKNKQTKNPQKSGKNLILVHSVTFSIITFPAYKITVVIWCLIWLRGKDHGNHKFTYSLSLLYDAISPNWILLLNVINYSKYWYRYDWFLIAVLGKIVLSFFRHPYRSLI